MEEVSMPTLGDFVRARRLSAGWRTQQELAECVPCAPGYLAAIEQNSKVPSEKILAKFSELLRLTESERRHMYLLAQVALPVASQELSEAHLAKTLSAFEYPAAFWKHWRVVAANDPFRTVWPGLSDAPNLLTWLLADPRSKRVTPNWEREVAVAVGRFRHYAAAPEHRGVAEETLTTLREFAVFRHWWGTNVVYDRRPEPRRRVWNPYGGEDGRGAETVLHLIDMRVAESDLRLTVGVPD
ncbi:helix-turn-helix domain-containing protein [Nocardia otitidiscaviarum]|uniref:helix-turn-helix domain-containing protein n=1 Tax=Nocardia otitidiscaviarum TaxID=1823 RepID=UPI00189349BB|nr:helix-turn-helix domain-containing protein [Nocardia otitidiscaviarum]MBF6238279.1 helix-turn-helix domain-containing protein [Nocardia otitidiscaviarum]